jgi:hypothetical protein
MKPMSAIWSASSRTVTATADSAVATLDQVLQPSGRRHDDLGAAAQRTGLPADRHPADDRGHPQLQRPGVRGERVGDLLGQLAGRDEDQRERKSRLGALPGGTGQHGQAEGEGLARAGAAAAEHVTAGEGVGQRRALDGERHGHALGGERREQLLGHVEVGEPLDGGQCGGHRDGEGELALRRGGPAAVTAGAATSTGAAGGTRAGGSRRAETAAAAGATAATGAGKTVVGTCAVHTEPSSMWHVSRNYRSRGAARRIARTSQAESENESESGRS